MFPVDKVQAFFGADKLHKFLIGFGLVVLGLVIIRVINLLAGVLLRRLPQQHELILRKILSYTLNLLLFVLALSYFGVDLRAILGTVGILGIVVGIASQSAIGNIISGIFLISERAFQIGDILRIDTHVGEVYSIDLLSIRLKTFDGMLMRIPNQMLLTSRLVNITKFPFRRIDYELRFRMDAPLPTIRQLLLDIARRTPGCLNVPEPVVSYRAFGPNGIELLFGIWVERMHYPRVKNEVFLAIQQQMLQAGIEMPYATVQLMEADPRFASSDPTSVHTTPAAPSV